MGRKRWRRGGGRKWREERSRSKDAFRSHRYDFRRRQPRFERTKQELGWWWGFGDNGEECDGEEG